MILGIYHPAQGVGHDTGVALIAEEGEVLAAPLSYRILWSTFYAVKNVVPGALVKTLERLGASYRRKLIGS